MERLKRVEDVVEKILEVREDARESDEVLYVYVCEYFCRGISSMSMEKFFFERHKTVCPTFKSVCRARRKLFNERPELKPKEKVTQSRKDMETIYRDYATN